MRCLETDISKLQIPRYLVEIVGRGKRRHKTHHWQSCTKDGLSASQNHPHTKLKPKRIKAIEDIRPQPLFLLVPCFLFFLCCQKISCSNLWWASSSPLLTRNTFVVFRLSLSHGCGEENSQSLVFSFRLLSLCCRVFRLFTQTHTLKTYIHPSCLFCFLLLIM